MSTIASFLNLPSATPSASWTKSRIQDQGFLSKPLPAPRRPLPFDLLSMAIPIPLSPTEPQYDDNGRQMSYAETSLQRTVRVDFLKHRTSERRVEDWVKGQQQSATELATLRSLVTPQPRRQTRSKRRGYVVPPRLRNAQPQAHEWAKPMGPQLLFDIPEDADEPFGYREPRIFYSTSPTLSFPADVLESPESPEQSSDSDSDASLSPPSSPSHLKRHTRSPSISSYTPPPSSSRSRSPRHRRRLSDLDVIPEE